MGKTLKELFKGSPQDTSVQPDKETLVEQETSGIRVRSAVELNNPLIYGNEAIRIVNRTTSTVEDMKQQTGGEASDGGLIGKGLSKLTGGKVSSISQARDAVNSKLGIPSNPIPSRLTEDIIKLGSSEPVTKDTVGKGLQGTGLGQFLKDTGGGNPKTLGKQALGNGIGKAKDLLRNKLFGSGGTIGEAVGEPIETNYSNTNPYTKVLKDNRDYKKEGGDAKEFDGIDLSLVSPVFGTKRKGNNNDLFPGKFGTSEYGFEDKVAGYRQVNAYEPDRQYTNENNNPSAIKADSLESKYGIGRSDSINLLQTSDYDTIDDYGVYKKGENKVAEDLIPFYIGKFGEKKTPFRAIISGLNESVSPSWSTNKMVGNPFPYYTYTQIERNTSFTLGIYCNSPLELATNWEKIEALTKMAYPKVNQNNLVNPPIIQFRLGDIYYDKTGFVESLTYTIPDNSTWETDGSFGFLPKYIEVSITIKFIEDTSVLNSLYGYKKSKAAIEKINEENNSAGFDENSITQRAGDMGSFGDRFGVEKEKPLKVNMRGIAPPPTLGITTSGNIPNKLYNPVKSVAPKGIATPSTPLQADTGFDDLKKSQSAISDKLDGKTPTEAVKETASKQGLPPEQAKACSVMKVMGYKEITRNQVDAFPDTKQWIKEEYAVNSKFFFRVKDRKYDVYQVTPSGESLRIDGGWEHNL